MNAPLKDLETRLNAALEGRPRKLSFGASARMRASLEGARDLAGNRRGMAETERVTQGLMALRLLENPGFVRLKYACRGLARANDWDSRRVLADRTLLEKLLAQVAALKSDERRFQSCRRALLAALQEADALPDPSCQEGRATLRRFLESPERTPTSFQESGIRGQKTEESCGAARR
ncbi:MAG: hypothetical protein LBC37_07565 [Zoogloeaceae bacterium]|jgi:hypothetical protein|nr:hypothetical protein [Zoogloeaceae bacterium]